MGGRGCRWHAICLPRRRPGVKLGLRGLIPVRGELCRLDEPSVKARRVGTKPVIRLGVLRKGRHDTGRYLIVDDRNLAGDSGRRQRLSDFRQKLFFLLRFVGR